MTDHSTGMMRSPKLDPTLSKDGTSVTLTLQNGGVQLGQVIFETSEFAAFLDEMAALRARMVDPVPEEVDIGARVRASLHPKWSVKLLSTTETPWVALALRHPGHGWVANLFSAAEAMELGACLLSVSQAQISAGRKQKSVTP